MQDIRLIELFAGYGSQAMALKRAGVSFNHYKVVEFDKYAIKSYNAVHGTDFIPMDITQVHAKDLGIVDTDKYTYLMTYSFPCTDLSLAGKMEGMSKSSGTRSGLLWEVERILNECKELPQFLLMENVPQVHSEKNIDDFNAWIGFLISKGYKNKWQDLNSKDYGIPQNRERCFLVSYLDKNIRFEFPYTLPLNTKILDFIQAQVDKKYYIPSLKSKEYLKSLNYNNETIRAITINTKHGILKDNIDIAATLCARDYKGFARRSSSNAILEKDKIRRLTPLECFRLMGVSDEDALKMISVNSNTQLYKQAGNSIVVDVMVEIFKNLFLGGSDNIPSQMDIYDFL